MENIVYSDINIRELILIAIYLFLLLVPMSLFIIKAISSIKQKKYIKSIIFSILTFASVFITIKVIYAVSPGGDKIIDRIKSPEGIELCLIQLSDFPGYNVSFYYKIPGSQWVWNYYDHEDTRWYKGNIELNQEKTMAFIKRGSKIVAKFDLKNHVLMKKVKEGNFIKSAQEIRPVEWSPEKLEYR